MRGADRLLPVIISGWIAGLAVVIWMAGVEASPSAVALPAPSTQTDGYVGSDACALCHADQFDGYESSPHFQTESGDWPARGCEGCHGPGEAHVGDPENVSMFFDPDDTTHTVRDKVDQCMTCHVEDTNTARYESSSHMKGAIDCASCHKVHESPASDGLLRVAQTESCLGCHQELRADLMMNERHRILEGMVTCADCHTQHGPSPRARLGGFNQETCTGCHTDKLQ